MSPWRTLARSALLLPYYAAAGAVLWLWERRPWRCDP